MTCRIVRYFCFDSICKAPYKPATGGDGEGTALQGGGSNCPVTPWEGGRWGPVGCLLCQQPTLRIQRHLQREVAWVLEGTGTLFPQFPAEGT